MMIITPCTLADADDLAHIHVEGWRASYGGLVPQDFLDGLDVAARAKNWAEWLNSGETTALIARDASGKAAGFISFGKLRTAPPGMSPVRPVYTAEIYALYILPEYWRHGLGRQLMAAAATALRTQKHRSLCLWVMEKNPRAMPFYKALGGQRCGSKTVEIGGKTLSEIAFGWRDANILQMPPS